jgi:exonuclease SbcD
MGLKKEATVLVVNDVHLHLDTLATGKDVLRQAVELCSKLEIGYLVLNGDLFTERKGQPLEVLLTVLWFKELCFEHGITVLAIAGNHDKADLESEDSFLDFFHGGEFKVYKKETCVKVSSQSYPLYLHLLPYFPEAGSLPERLRRLVEKADEIKLFPKSPGEHVLCMHAAISGVRNNDGSEVKNNLTADLFGGFASVVVGHYHNASTIGPNIHYTGSAYPRNHGEDNDKGFTIIYSDGSLKRIKAQFPEYNSYELSPAELTPEMMQSLRLEKESISNNLRVIVRATKAELKTYDLAPLLALGIDAKKKPLELDEAIEAAAENRVESHTAQTLLQQFEHFADGHGYSDEIREEGRKYLADLK